MGSFLDIKLKGVQILAEACFDRGFKYKKRHFLNLLSGLCKHYRIAILSTSYEFSVLVTNNSR